MKPLPVLGLVFWANIAFAQKTFKVHPLPAAPQVPGHLDWASSQPMALNDRNHAVVAKNYYWNAPQDQIGYVGNIWDGTRYQSHLSPFDPLKQSRIYRLTNTDLVLAETGDYFEFEGSTFLKNRKYELFDQAGLRKTWRENDTFELFHMNDAGNSVGRRLEMGPSGKLESAAYAMIAGNLVKLGNEGYIRSQLDDFNQKNQILYTTYNDAGGKQWLWEKGSKKEIKDLGLGFGIESASVLNDVGGFGGWHVDLNDPTGSLMPYTLQNGRFFRYNKRTSHYFEDPMVAMNNAGDAVNTLFPLREVDPSIPVLMSEGTLYDLNETSDARQNGLRLLDAQDINNRGWILCSASMNDGKIVPVLLEPVPEPASLLSLAVGVAALIRKRRLAA